MTFVLILLRDCNPQRIFSPLRVAWSPFWALWMRYDSGHHMHVASLLISNNHFLLYYNNNCELFLLRAAWFPFWALWMRYDSPHHIHMASILIDGHVVTVIVDCSALRASCQLRAVWLPFWPGWMRYDSPHHMHMAFRY